MNKFRWFTILFWIVISISSVTAQDSNANVAMTLERTACHGTCPIYSVTVLEDGSVIYEGENFVSVTGKQTSEIPAETVALMVEAFNDAGYFGWNEAYDTQTVSDLPTVITSVTHDGITHRIERYAGDYTAPLALSFLEQWIDAMANTSLWTGVQPDISGISNGMNTPLVTLERGPNFGLGPVYNIAAYEDGMVVYMGIANVNKIGVQVSHTDSVSITSIAQNAQLSGYFNWQDSYEERIITDQATVITSIQWADQSKRIVRYDGDPNAPIGIVWIEDNIDQLVTDLES
jgi:hypothetical protein